MNISDIREKARPDEEFTSAETAELLKAVNPLAEVRESIRRMNETFGFGKKTQVQLLTDKLPKFSEIYKFPEICKFPELVGCGKKTEIQILGEKLTKMNALYDVGKMSQLQILKEQTASLTDTLKLHRSYVPDFGLDAKMLDLTRGIAGMENEKIRSLTQPLIQDPAAPWRKAIQGLTDSRVKAAEAVLARGIDIPPPPIAAEVFIPTEIRIAKRAEAKQEEMLEVQMEQRAYLEAVSVAVGRQMETAEVLLEESRQRDVAAQARETQSRNEESKRWRVTIVFAVVATFVSSASLAVAILNYLHPFNQSTASPSSAYERVVRPSQALVQPKAQRKIESPKKPSLPRSKGK